MSNLPQRENAVISRRKITDYLLSDDHPVGRFKSAFFRAYGFTSENWQLLEMALLEHAREQEVAKIVDTPYGTKYLIDGPLKTPDGRSVVIRAIWFIVEDGQEPVLVTAYPLKETA